MCCNSRLNMAAGFMWSLLGPVGSLLVLPWIPPHPLSMLQVKCSAGVTLTQNKRENAALAEVSYTHAVTVNTFDLLYTVAQKKTFYTSWPLLSCYFTTSVKMKLCYANETEISDIHRSVKFIKWGFISFFIFSRVVADGWKMALFSSFHNMCAKSVFCFSHRIKFYP